MQDPSPVKDDPFRLNLRVHPTATLARRPPADPDLEVARLLTPQTFREVDGQPRILTCRLRAHA
jgi:hypothetical protein